MRGFGVCKDIFIERGLVILALLFLASCSSTGSQVIYSPGSGSVTSTEEERQQVLEQQRTLAAERARQQEAEEARRLAEIEAEERRAEEARLAEERARREAEQQARREAERQRELAARRAAEQARIVVAQQARIEELRAQISANEEETENLEAANAVLSRAVSAAERLTDALVAEEEKYNSTDPVTGETLQALDVDRLDALAEEVEALSNQAESMMAQP